MIRDIEITYHFVPVLMKTTKDPHCLCRALESCNLVLRSAIKVGRMVATAGTSILDSRLLLNPNGGCKRTSLHSDYLLSFKKVLKVSVITATLPSTSPKIATSVIMNV